MTGRTRNHVLVDRAAAGAAFGLLDDLELVVQSLDSTAARLLRTGGLCTRDVTALARRLGSDPYHAIFLLEAAYAARLVAAADRRPGPHQRVRRLAAGTAAASGGGGSPRPGGPRPGCSPARAAAGAHALGPEADFPGVA